VKEIEQDIFVVTSKIVKEIAAKIPPGYELDVLEPCGDGSGHFKLKLRSIVGWLGPLSEAPRHYGIKLKGKVPYRAGILKEK